MTGVYVVIAKGDEQVDAEYLLPSDSLAAAYWPQTEMMIFREDEGPGEFTFYDLVNRRDMWAWAPALERPIDQPGREPAEPTSTAPASLPAEGDE